MWDYLYVFSDKYEYIKLYVLLLPYYNYVKHYTINPCDICVYTSDRAYNTDIYYSIKRFFKYKLVSVDSLNDYVAVDEDTIDYAII